ncbi:MAG: prepilin peptidase [Agathobacter sp.]|nr:prepilin peptidase [Agathobacter sp.]
MISMLLIQSYWDMRYKEIPIIVTIVGGMIGCIGSVVQQRVPIDVLCAMIPGIVCLILGKVTRQAIGYGDGFLLCAMGMYVSCEGLLAILMNACIFAGVVALALLVFRRKKGKDQIPFVPFLLAASIFQYVIEKGSIL